MSVIDLKAILEAERFAAIATMSDSAIESNT